MTAVFSARTLGDVLRIHAVERPHKVALTTASGHQVSFGELNERANRLNDAVARLGLKKGSRAAILSRNRPEYVEVYALSKSGVIVVPLNWRLAAAELLRLLLHAEPEVLFVDGANRHIAEDLREKLPCVRHFVALDEWDDGWLSYGDLLSASNAAEPDQAALAEDVLCLMYTSGTTATPKGVALTHAGVLGNARTAVELLRLTEQDRTLAAMPMFHVGGMWYHLFPSLAAGCTTWLLAEFDPEVVLRQLEANRITNVHLVPTMIAGILALPAAATANLSHLRLIFYAASSMPAELLRRAMDRFSEASFAQSYGSTEAGIVSALDPETHRRAQVRANEHLLHSCGTPCTGHAVRIVDADEQVVERGQIGEIEVSSADVMKGYWRDEASTRAVLRAGWLKTGDLGYLDDEAFLYIVDRKNDMVITGGENVFPTQVESALYREPEVLEAAVFGVPDPVWVEKVVAAVVLKPGARISEQQLIHRLRSELAPYKCPKQIHFTDNLPKSAVGKVLRKALRKQYAPH
jgi:acyl-CoA synthetase (AMP-forming)/AMP-acid ligase II